MAYLLLYSISALLFTPDGVFVGPDAIRPLFQQLIDEFSRPGASFEMKTQPVEGDYAFLVWAAETVDTAYESTTDTCVIQEGRIVARWFAAKVLPKGGNGLSSQTHLREYTNFHS